MFRTVGLYDMTWQGNPLDVLDNSPAVHTESFSYVQMVPLACVLVPNYRQRSGGVLVPLS